MSDYGFETRQIHAGSLPDLGHGARITPIHQSAGYVFESFDDGADRFQGRAASDRLVYSRSANPTNAVAERRLAELEGGIGAVLTGSGQAAIFSAILAVASAGDNIVATASLYEGTKQLFRNSLTRQGLTFRFVDQDADDETWASAIDGCTRAVYTETIPNPKNDVVDIPHIAELAHRSGLPLIVDSTVTTPYLQRPLDLGADIVVHSTSKWLAGHGAVLGGAIVSGAAFDWGADPARYPQFQAEYSATGESYIEHFGPAAYFGFLRSSVINEYGPTQSAQNAWLLLLGLETLSLRMDRHVANTEAIVEYLAHAPHVRSIDHPAAPGNKYAEIARRLLPRGAGAVVSFELEGGYDAARIFIDSLRLISPMTHIGDVRSLAIHTGSTIHSKLTEEERLAIGITPGLIRLSVGLETVDDIVADLDQAIAAAHA